MNNRITDLFGIKYPIIQAGMVWCSGWKLASSVSNGGGLGLLGAGSMYPDTLQEHIQKCKNATSKPFGVNVPLMYPQVEEVMEIIIRNKVPVVFTSVFEKQRIYKVLELAAAIFEKRKRRILTSKLNDFLLPLIENTPPPSASRGRYLKIKYIMQLKTATPQFLVMA